MIFKLINFIRGNLIGFKLNILSNVHFGFPLSGIEKLVSIKLTGSGRITIQKKIYVRKYSDLECHGGNLQIGERVFFNKNCNVICRSKITIGNDCMFGESVSIYDHDHDISFRPFSKKKFILNPIEIGNNVWVGCHVFIGKGVKIGNNIVIGAGSVVTKDIPSNTIFTNSKTRTI